jgi:hypothetical protein
MEHLDQRTVSPALDGNALHLIDNTVTETVEPFISLNALGGDRLCCGVARKISKLAVYDVVARSLCLLAGTQLSIGSDQSSTVAPLAGTRPGSD